MGLDINIFLNPQVINSLPNLKCKICQKVVEDPYETACGHVFCKNCLLIYLKSQANCLVCNTPIDTNNIRPSNVVQNLLNPLKIKCLNCNWQGTIANRAFHVCQNQNNNNQQKISSINIFQNNNVQGRHSTKQQSNNLIDFNQQKPIKLRNSTNTQNYNSNNDLFKNDQNNSSNNNNNYNRNSNVDLNNPFDSSNSNNLRNSTSSINSRSSPILHHGTHDGIEYILEDDNDDYKNSQIKNYSTPNFSNDPNKIELFKPAPGRWTTNANTSRKQCRNCGGITSKSTEINDNGLCTYCTKWG
eukprot:TRINITY_DN2718_c0_g1_i1.p1 TRINITY_DN2718_c0_g1~~TRINITY_DN2718_c0_g1_i1.p1  ORF type:complete len:300 (-),score=64.40 TRINITY_DN2718_c0_g1_i1:54-953(-)